MAASVIVTPNSMVCMIVSATTAGGRAVASGKHKKIQRLWREKDLRVPQRRRRKRRGTSIRAYGLL